MQSPPSGYIVCSPRVAAEAESPPAYLCPGIRLHPPHLALRCNAQLVDTFMVLPRHVGVKCPRQMSKLYARFLTRVTLYARSFDQGVPRAISSATLAPPEKARTDH